jgi:hypothetical protein
MESSRLVGFMCGQPTRIALAESKDLVLLQRTKDILTIMYDPS